MKVLVIDDEQIILKCFERALRKVESCEFFLADSLAAAEKLWKSEEPDLVFVDYVLGDGVSKDLVLNKELPAVKKVVLMSAFHSVLDQEDELQSFQILKKPFENLHLSVHEIASAVS